MSWQMTERVYSDKSLTHKSGRSVMLALAHRYNEKTGKCNPSIRTLMDMTQQSSQGVRNGLDFLVANQYIQKVKGGGRGHSTSYLPYPETGNGVACLASPEIGAKTPETGNRVAETGNGVDINRQRRSTETGNAIAQNSKSVSEQS